MVWWRKNSGYTVPVSLVNRGWLDFTLLTDASVYGILRTYLFDSIRPVTSILITLQSPLIRLSLTKS